MYKIKIKHRDEPHLFVLEYPDDKQRWIEFSIMAPVDDPEWEKKKGQGDPWRMARVSTGGITGDRFPLSMQLKRLSLLYFAAEEEIYACVNTGAGDQPAAAHRILVYRMRDLPKLKVESSGERFLGIHSERGYGFRSITGCKGRRISWHLNDWYHVWSPDHFAFWFKAIERYAKYLRFSGQNLHVMGCYQYDEFNTPYILNYVGKTSRLDPDYRDIMVRVFGENGIATLAGVELTLPKYLYLPWAKGISSDSAMAKGEETIYNVSSRGVQIVSPNRGLGHPNIFHPLVQQSYLSVFREICRKFASVAEFKGFYCVDVPGFMGYVMPGNESLEKHKKSGFEDYTISIFEKDTGINIPIEKKDPDRFNKRYKWIMANVQSQWVQWRCNKLADIRGSVEDEIKHYRKDLKLIIAYHYPHYPPNMNDFLASGLDFNSYIKWDGQDLDLYRNSDNIAFARYGYVNGGWGPKNYKTGLQIFESPRIISAFKGFKNRTVCIKSIFHENKIRNTYSEKWPWSEFYVMGPPFPGAEHGGWAFARAMSDSDPDTIIFGWTDDDVFPGHEAEIRNFAQGYLALPKNEFKDVMGNLIDKKIIVRSLSQNDETFYYFLNPLWKEGRVKVELTEGSIPIDLIDGKSISFNRTKGRIQFVFDITSYGLRSFKLSGKHFKIRSVEFSESNLN